MFIGFDFDDTLFEQEPGHIIGKPIQDNIDLLKQLAEEGETIIIFSGREVDEIEKKVKEFNLPVSAINDKKLKEFEWYQTPSGKPYFDMYIGNEAMSSKESKDKILDMVRSLRETEKLVKELR